MDTPEKKNTTIKETVSEKKDAESCQEVKTLLTWKSPGRPFRKKKKQYYLSGILIMLFIEIILFLFSEYFLMALIASFTFVAFALASVPPHDFVYRISTEGVMVEEDFYLWQELYDFYFKKRNGIDVLHIRTHAFFPGEIVITLGTHTPDEIKHLLLSFLPYREFIKPSFVEKSASWLTHNFPLEG